MSKQIDAIVAAVAAVTHEHKCAITWFERGDMNIPPEKLKAITERVVQKLNGILWVLSSMENHTTSKKAREEANAMWYHIAEMQREITATTEEAIEQKEEQE